MTYKEKIAVNEIKLSGTLELKDRIDIINKLGFLLLDYDLKRSSGLCHEAISLSASGKFQANPYEYGIVSAKMNLCNIMMISGQSEKALEMSKELFQLIGSREGYDAILTNLYIVYGVSLSHLDDAPGALEYLHKAVSRAEEARNTELISFSLINIANTYGSMGEYEKAFDFYERSIGNRHDDKDCLALAYNNMAATHLEAGTYEKAFSYAEKSLALTEENKISTLRPYVLDTIGSILKHKGFFDEAVEYLLRSEKASAEGGFLDSLLYADLNLGSTYNEMGDLRAFDYINKAFELSVKLNMKTEMYKCHEEFFRFYENQGDLIKAVEHYKLFHKLQMEVFRNSHDQKVRILNVLHDTELLRQKIKDKETLIKEIHHRVKNNLNMVSSLVKLKAAEKGTRAEIGEIVNQIQAISLVHDKLYRDEDVTEIDMHKYSEELLETVFSSISALEVEVQNKVEHLMLPGKMITILGLIINEAAVNAVKHAFKPGIPCLFSISLKKTDCCELVLSNSLDNSSVDTDLSGRSDSLGMTLIRALVQQLGGSLEIQTIPCFALTIRF